MNSLVLTVSENDPWHKKLLIGLINWLVWGIPGFVDAFGEYVGPHYQMFVGVLGAAVLAVWSTCALFYFGGVFAGWWTLAACVGWYLLAGAAYHLNLRHMDGRWPFRGYEYPR